MISDPELNQIRQQIINTTSTQDMRETYLLLIDRVKASFRTDRNVAECLGRIHAIRDAMAERILLSVETDMAGEGFGIAPMNYCWVAAGSAGRGEETFVTDQDFFLIYEVAGPDGENDSRKKTTGLFIDEFCRRAVDMFHAVGVARCKGGIVPSNYQWRGSAEIWKRRIDRKCDAFETFLVDLFVLIDARPIVGSIALFDEVKGHLFTRMLQSRQVLTEMARLAVSIPTTGFLGHPKRDSKGKHRGMINFKLTGRVPLTLCLQCLSLVAGIRQPSLSGRISGLEEAGLIRGQLGSELQQGMMLFLRYRMINEIEGKDRGELNYVDPSELSKEERSNLRSAVSSVRSLQKVTQKELMPLQLTMDW